MFYSAGHILCVFKIMLSCWNQWGDKTPNICYTNSWPIMGFNSSGPLTEYRAAYKYFCCNCP